MGRSLPIKDVEGLAEFVKEHFVRKGIHRLSDLDAYRVREVWAMIVVADDPSFAHLISAMRANQAVFRDCNPNKVNLLGDDLSDLGLSKRAENPLRHYAVLSFELLRRLRGKDLIEEVRAFGPKQLDELKLALAERGVELAG